MTTKCKGKTKSGKPCHYDAVLLGLCLTHYKIKYFSEEERKKKPKKHLKPIRPQRIKINKKQIDEPEGVFFQ